MKVTAVVIDLEWPDEHGLAELPRSMVPIAGIPVLRRVLRTLYGCLAVRHVVALGEPDILAQANFGAELRHARPENLGEALAAVALANPEPGLLLVSPDRALLHGAHLSAFLDSSEVSGADATFGIVDAHGLRRAYPGHVRPHLGWPGPPQILGGIAYVRNDLVASRADRIARILQTHDRQVWFGGSREATEERLSQLLHTRVLAVHTFPEAALGISGPGDSDYLNSVFTARSATHGPGAARLG